MNSRHAFTLFEIILTMLILGIAAATILPVAGNVTSPRLRTAANVLASDIEYCSSECIAQPSSPRAISFNLSANTYTMVNLATGVAIKHPADSMDYINDFATGRNIQLNGVTITGITMGNSTLSTLTFDAYGKPLITADLVITLSYKNTTMTVTVKNTTGDVSIAGG